MSVFYLANLKFMLFLEEFLLSRCVYIFPIVE